LKTGSSIKSSIYTFRKDVMVDKDTVNVKPRKFQAAGKLVNRAVLIILSKDLLGKS